MTLRCVHRDDAAGLAALSIEVWVGTYLRAGVGAPFARHALETFTEDTMAARIVAAGGDMIVSQNREGPDGYVQLRRDAPCPVAGWGDVEIATLYVQPRHHGRGIGAALLAAACARVGDAGGVWVATNAENAPAIEFYRAQGFAVVGETAYSIEGRDYPNVVLARAVGVSDVPQTD